MIKVLVLGAGGSPAINFVKALKMVKPPLGYGRLLTEEWAEKWKPITYGIDTNHFNLEVANTDYKYFLHSYSTKLEKLNELIEREEINFVHAQPDNEVLWLAENKHKIKAHTLVPDEKVVRKCQNKIVCNILLKSRGVPVPESSSFSSLGDINFPVWFRIAKGQGGYGSLLIDNVGLLFAWRNYWRKKGIEDEEMMISEYLPGNEVSWLSLWKSGKLITSQARTREAWLKPANSPTGISGTTAVQRTIHSKNVNKIGYDTIHAIDGKPNGIYVVDMKENKLGKFHVTEINCGRFFTTSDFIPHLGVNIPYIYVLAGLNMPLPKVKKYNCVPEGFYWIRVLDAESKVFNGKWTSQEL